MLRLRSLCCLSQRLLQVRAVSSDQVLHQLTICSSEEQVLDIVGKNRAKLSVKHVSYAIGLLWKLQTEKPEFMRSSELIRRHSQFLTLCILAENKIEQMDDDILVDTLYNSLRLNVEPCDSLIQHLVMEAYSRLENLSMPTLSKFAVCLNDQQLHHSPVMGKICNILSERLDYIREARVLSSLMICTSSLTSSKLRDKLIEKATILLDTMHPTRFHDARRVVQFLRNIKHGYRPLLEKSNKIFLNNVKEMNVENINMILGLYQSLQFNNFDFRLASKQRLLELMDSCTEPVSFSRLLTALGPMAGQETRERLENAALILVDEAGPHQALATVETLVEMECRNPLLINKIASVLHKHLDVYKPTDVARITQALLLLHCQNPELFTKLKRTLLSYLKASFLPYEVTILTRVLSMFPSQRLDMEVISRVRAVMPQCTLSDLNSFSGAIAKWVRHDPSYQHATSSVYVNLLQSLNKTGMERLQKADNLDMLLDELKHSLGEWFEEILLQETMATLERLIDGVNCNNTSDLALFLTRTNQLCLPLLDKIANITVEHIDKVHYTATYATILPFAVLNYDPPQGAEFFDACIQHFRPHLGSFDPHLLVLLAYALAVADIFPEDLIRAIFNVDFLAKLDAQLDILPDALNMRIRLRLMELNRAVCLECPEFQIPWFHDKYCQHLLKKGNGSIRPQQQHIHKMLGEILGGINKSKAGVITPYFYPIDFEFILDKKQEAIPYVDQSNMLPSELGKLLWGKEAELKDSIELPPGSQRVAVEFLDSKSFCKNSNHIKGETAMRKRHLEILGYRVVQIPHFEWNSMELSTSHAWKEYLRKKIFVESVS
ncbi:FAST kinase domain-containing protein 1, mitochondrial [Polypterus senegalus]|uniref:FAST kinase domain-containing protein 1, mitochondrial n=1 Tax=Polypterus senegalus TaxID=55291 RepID=UPI0019636314|nr:FAST kinase domain-containing protein 1, mitochondrial [Polypterus senegalus]